jgi:hypothetical protein
MDEDSLKSPEEIFLPALDEVLPDDLARRFQDRRLVPRVDDPDPPTNAEYQNF